LIWVWVRGTRREGRRFPSKRLDFLRGCPARKGGILRGHRPELKRHGHVPAPCRARRRRPGSWASGPWRCRSTRRFAGTGTAFRRNSPPARPPRRRRTSRPKPPPLPSPPPSPRCGWELVAADRCMWHRERRGPAARFFWVGVRVGVAGRKEGVGSWRGGCARENRECSLRRLGLEALLLPLPELSRMPWGNASIYSEALGG
jgi:hypothetical protein